MKILIQQIRNIVDGLLNPTDVSNWNDAYNHSLISGDLSIHHSHSNFTLLDSLTGWTNSDIITMLSDAHLHGNLALLETYTNSNASITTAVTQSHSHSNKALLDTLTGFTNSDLVSAISLKHSHLNKTLLDSLSGFTISELLDTISNTHTHSNITVLNTTTASFTTALKTNYDTAYSNTHTHSNSSTLDNLTQSVIDNTHTHTNKVLLDSIISSGDGLSFLANDGTYKPASLAAAGNDTEVLFNNSGSVAGNSTFTFNTSTNLVSVSSLLSTNEVFVADSTTYLSKNVGNDLVFTDANSGSITLATLVSGSVNPWTINTGYLNYGTGTDKVGINTTTDPTEALEVVGNIAADYFNSSYFRYKDSNLLIGPLAGLNETSTNKLYIANSSTELPLIKGDFSVQSLEFNADTYINTIKRLCFGTSDVHIRRDSSTNDMLFSDPNTNNGDPVKLSELYNTGVYVTEDQFTQFSAVASITSADKVTWNKASVINNTGAGDAFLANDGTYRIVSGGGNEVILYLHDDVSDVSGYEKLLTTPASGVGASDTVAVASGTSPVLLDDYVTEPGYPGLSQIPAGLWSFTTYLSVSSATGTTTVTIRVYKRASGGTETELFNVTTPEINSTTALDYPIETVQPAYSLDPTDRLVVKYYVSTTSVSSLNTTLYYEGTLHYSHIHIPLTSDSGTLVPTDNVLKWDTSSLYYRPYSSKTEAGGASSGGKFYLGLDLPTNSTRLTYDGYLYSSALYSLSTTPSTWGSLTWDSLVFLDSTVTRTRLYPHAANGDTAVAYLFDTHNNLTTSGAKLLSVKNNGTEKTFIDKDGNIDITGQYKINGVALTQGLTSLADGILDWSTDKYAPYTSFQADSFYFGITNPTGLTRLNWDGYLHSTKLIGVSGIEGYSTTGTAIQGYSTSNGIGLVGTSSYGIAGQFTQQGTSNTSANIIEINRTSSGSFNTIGNIINITDNPSTSGTIGGKILTAVIGSTERISFNPRIASTGSSVAYLLDTHNTFTSGDRILSIRNHGSEITNFDISGINTGLIRGGQTTLTIDGATNGYHLALKSTSTIRTQLFPNVTDGASSIAYIFDTHNSLSTSGAKLMSVRNNGTEKFSIDKDGAIYSAVGLTVTGDSNLGASSALYFGASGTDGSWRIVRNGTSLEIQRRESGSWIMKLEITA